MKKTNTWQARIFCGLRKEYSDIVYPISFIYEICQKYVDMEGWCVIVTPTKYIYKNGEEDGAIIGIIDYPRFPLLIEELKKRTMELARELLINLKQIRITIVFPDETIMLEREDET